jgi:hypothetical protein
MHNRLTKALRIYLTTFFVSTWERAVLLPGLHACVLSHTSVNALEIISNASAWRKEVLKCSDSMNLDTQFHGYRTPKLSKEAALWTQYPLSCEPPQGYQVCQSNIHFKHYKNNRYWLICTKHIKLTLSITTTKITQTLHIYRRAVELKTTNCHRWEKHTLALRWICGH